MSVRLGMVLKRRRWNTLAAWLANPFFPCQSRELQPVTGGRVCPVEQGPSIQRPSHQAMKRILLASTLAVLVPVLSGCVIAMGNRDLGQRKPVPATLGQELTDLKKARDAGAIGEDEYQAQKKR